MEYTMEDLILSVEDWAYDHGVGEDEDSEYFDLRIEYDEADTSEDVGPYIPATDSKGRSYMLYLYCGMVVIS